MRRASEERALLAETADKIFGELAGTAADWQAIEDNGITALFLSEAEGGFGGGWEDAFVLMRAAGLHCIALPLAETLLARRWLGKAQLTAPSGPIAIALCPEAALAYERGQWRLSGQCGAVPWGDAVEHVLVVVDQPGKRQIAMVDRASFGVHSPHLTVARESAANLHFDGCAVHGLGVLEEDALCASALLRAVLMAGALSATLQLSVQHANERRQFGRPIGKFQAVQHALALLANEVAAVDCAALAACRAADCGDAELEIAAAKLRANRAAGVATSIAHQVHGAIGFTMEHRLHRATQRLWTWRSEYGNDRYWASRLGGIAARCGTQGLWAHLTARSDLAADGET